MSLPRKLSSAGNKRLHVPVWPSPAVAVQVALAGNAESNNARREVQMICGNETQDREI
jgi:hypothetical protein